jgi:hypothetical protein
MECQLSRIYHSFAPEIIKFILQHADSPPFDMEQQNSVGFTVFYNFMFGYRESIREDDDFDVPFGRKYPLYSDQHRLEANTEQSHGLCWLLHP